MSKVFIIAPANLVTGGPELCHQLADALNKDSKRARIVYYPFTSRHETPGPYRRYNVYPAGVEDIEPGSTVVLPEVYANMVTEFPESRIYFWWLSVGNFFRRAAKTGDTVGKQLDALRSNVARHLYQSDHARIFLESVSLMPASRLSDCLSEGYIQAIADPPASVREDIVVYNPVKGSSRTEQIIRVLNKRIGETPKIVPVKDMTPEQVRELLGRAKVYIDFGGHPGKDRLPREAAALGACVLTNRRGSAANPIDLPIPDELKINDRKPGFERRAAGKIRMLMSDFDRHAPRYDRYRRMIAREPAGFRDDVDAVFGEEV